MYRKVSLTIIALLCAFSFLIAQTKSLQAVKVLHAPKLDGKLDDDAWQNVPVATDFIINFPDFGDRKSVV